MKIKIPEMSLVVLIGASSSGKSSFAKKYFKTTEIISSDYCRALVSDNENDMNATEDAFDALHYITAKRLKRGNLTVIDATNTQAENRKKLITLAKQYHVLPVAIVFNMPLLLLEERHQQRTDRDFGKHVLLNHQLQLKKSLKTLSKEGFREIYIFHSEEKVNALEEVIREPLWNNKKHEKGGFDIIGDIHGCFDELLLLLEKLGYRVNKEEKEQKSVFHIEAPENRRMIFLGDLVDRGYSSPDVLKLVMQMVEEGKAFCVPGNHDMKLLDKLKGKNVAIKHGLAETLEQLEKEPADFIEKVKKFLDSLISHYVLDEGKLVVAHAGLMEEMQGRGSGVVRAFCLFGETTGEIDEFGLPVRYNWAKEYKGKAMVVYGHTPIPEAEWLNHTINIDTGCVFGGKLTALRYPEKELAHINAKKTYCEPVRPVEKIKAEFTAQQNEDDLLDIAEVLGKQLIKNRFSGAITIREENSISALEVMSRFGINPKWLIYLPPTMSPSATSTLPDLLEHPKEAFDYYLNEGVEEVICEQKHMGSRAILVICKNEETVKKRFGISGNSIGVIYTKTGRSFFKEPDKETAVLSRVHRVLTEKGFWDHFLSDWVCLDCELMPWSAKARELLKNQYAAAGSSASNVFKFVKEVLQKTGERELPDLDQLQNIYYQRIGTIEKYIQTYRNYCWEVKSIDDYQIAPFHILATENKVYDDQNHLWHMKNIQGFCTQEGSILVSTPYRIVNLKEEKSRVEAYEWWNELTEKGREGIVVKPLQFLVKNEKGDLIQPAIKCRGKEYLRIIYGPEYTLENHLKKLKFRSLNKKRSLAIREFILGLEALHRFTENTPLRQVHQCVFGILALESEEVDPRL